jgi:hypothetical protein
VSSDRSDGADEPLDRRDSGGGERQAAHTADARAETRSRPEYYADLRIAVSAEESVVPKQDSAPEKVATEKWQVRSAESRWIWEEYQRKWRVGESAGMDRSSDPPNPSSASASLDHAVNSRLEAECERIAQRERERISPVLRAAESQEASRHLIGFEHRLKGQDRIAEKVYDSVKFLKQSPEEAVSLVPDAIRYTFQYRETDYTRCVWTDISRLKEKGFELQKMKNSWSSDQYKGINSQWIDPDVGQRFEVQFHTRISFEAKQLTHSAYERLRTGRADMLEELVLEAFQKKVTADVPVPPGADDIPDYP